MNNRQAGRRRGRGGQQRQGGGNANQGNGNRIDNRARGNAAQLLEKYKNLARDAQMQGDRVNAEYYLQFADHYFRVLSETRSRFEENNNQRRPREDSEDDDDFDYEADGNRTDEPREHEIRESRTEREPRAEREPREDRGERRNGRANGNGHANGSHVAETEVEVRDERPAREERPARDDEQRSRRPVRARREEAPRREVEADAPAGIDAAILPPALGVTDTAGDAPEEKPRRRGRRPRTDEVPAA